MNFSFAGNQATVYSCELSQERVRRSCSLSLRHEQINSGVEFEVARGSREKAVYQLRRR
jgi:hypothetical protein